MAASKILLQMEHNKHLFIFFINENIVHWSKEAFET